ncbi:glutamate synthase-related protein, partial [Candidatus Riflebacteria bacterium]
MTEQQHLEPRPAPPRHPVLRPYRLERSDKCINCGTCITACLYECHERSLQDSRKMADPLNCCCRNCFSCIFHCPRAALSMHPSKDYLEQGDSTYTPQIILSTLEQAAEGKIPVSGSGYGGPFDGPGYDNIWTDMSEIVRPTRDGIHGREHISTAINLGRKVRDLCNMKFDAAENLKSQIPPTREVPIPVLFGLSPFSPGEAVTAAISLAASKLTTYATIHASDQPERFKEYFNHILIHMRADEVELHRQVLEWATIVEFEPDSDPSRAIGLARKINPHLLTILRVPARNGVEKEILKLAQEGVETIHLSADMHGRGVDGTDLLTNLQHTHRTLVEKGIRDSITLLASGGVAAAEHVPKTIILGADAVFVDVPLLIAMECSLCGGCREKEKCPRQLQEIDRRWGAMRIINLMLCWRDQLLEVLGAMG